MRKVTYGGAVSLDYFIARPGGEVDWLMWDKDAAAITGEYWPKVDTLIMGRKTYEAGLANAPEGTDAGAMFGGVTTYIFSRTLEPGERGGPIFTADDPAETVRKLKDGPGKEICVMGGGDLARTLAEAGLIDEIGLNIHPVLLGSGIPFFQPLNKQIDLELAECRQLKNGCVYVVYRLRK